MNPIAASMRAVARAISLTFAGVLLVTSTFAQDVSGDQVLEEIIVISKVRGAVSVMDEPVAITAVTGAQIEQSGIKDMYDLQVNVPGLIVGGSQTTTTSNFAIRGIGSTSNNFGVESSVGLYVDGVYRSRQSSLINELVDVEAVEVLRGPQGTLFGKNTAAGAINIRTVAPSTDGPDAFFEMTAGDLSLLRFSGAANIPLTDKLAFRGTVFSSNRDGYVDNHVYDLATPSLTVQDNVFNDRDRLGVRLQLGYDNADDLTVRVIGDYSEIDEICCIGTSRVDSVIRRSATNPGITDFGPDFARLMTGGIVFTDYPYPDPLPTTLLFTQLNAGFAPYGLPPFPEADLPFPNIIGGVSWDDYVTSVNRLPVSKNEDRGLSVEINKDFANTTLTSVTAYRAFDTFDHIDADFTDTRIAERINDAKQESISQELRLAGTFGDSSNWVVGAYYFAQEIESNTVTTAGDQLQEFIDLDRMIQGDLPLAFVTQAVDMVSAALGQQGIPFPGGAQGFPAGAFANDDVKQEHDGFAVFGQIDWALTDNLSLALGARYTDETKDIDAVYTQTNPGTAYPNLPLIVQTLLEFNAYLQGQIPAPPDPAPLLAVAQPNEGWAAYTIPAFSPRPNVNETLKDDQVTGTASITWYPSDSTMLYASYATGFKSGGTNSDRLEFDPNDPDNPLFSQLFDAETSKSIELGFKGDIGDNFRLTAALYQTEFEDFQENTFEGAGFILRNAGDLEITGIELEWLWQVFDNTAITGYYAHNDGEYKSFIRGVCWDATPFHTGQPDPGDNGTAGGCDRSGDALPYNPEDRLMLSFNQDFPMGSNNLFLRAEYIFASETTTDGDTDPLTTQDDFSMLNLRVGVDIDDWNSTITLWGRNVTDERHFSGSFDPPLLDRGRMNSYPTAVATYGITFRKNWD
jgi:iron complex outermembrane receptor protein